MTAEEMWKNWKHATEFHCNERGEVVLTLELTDAMDADICKFAREYAAQSQSEPKEIERKFQAILEAERTKVSRGVTEILHILNSRDWLTEGRGPYQWNDDNWHKEFAYACKEIRTALEPLQKIACDLSNCPTNHDDVVEARKLISEPAVGEVSQELIIEICRELYDRFVMGGWEPRDVYDWLQKKLAEPAAGAQVGGWISVKVRLPDVRKPIEMTGDSGYVAPHDHFVISGYYDPEFRPLSPWLDSTSTCTSEMGWIPTHWRYLSKLPVPPTNKGEES